MSGRVEASGSSTDPAGCCSRAVPTALPRRCTLPNEDGEWLNPAAPGAVQSDPTTWGNGVHGRAIISFLQQRATELAADRPLLLLRMHSEYDSTHGGTAAQYYRHTLPRPSWAANVPHLGEVRMVLQRSEALTQVQ